MRPTLQSIFNQHFASYAKQRKLPVRVHRAARAIMTCGTAARGGHVQRCPDGHVARIHYNACRHRSCPRCATLPRARWVQAQAARLLPCDHYHVVFTLPHELLPLWEYNRQALTRVLFDVAADTLQTLLRDERFLGATPGITMALHTWGRTLNRHPHVHCLVSGGGITRSGEWTAVRNGYLLPIRVVKALYQGKLLSRLREMLTEDALRLPPSLPLAHWQHCLTELRTKNFNVHLQTRYPHGHGVMLYLSRYVKGGPLGESRLETTHTASVAFRYQDHRDGRNKSMTLPAPAFIDRLLWHAPVERQHTVRHYGLYASAAAQQRARCWEILGQTPPPPPQPLTWQAYLERQGAADRVRCPQCRQPLVHAGRLPRNENSLPVRPARGFAQQLVPAHTPNAPPFSGGAPPTHRDIFLPRGVTLN